MFDKIRYAYHLTACKRMIKKYKYINHDTYELNKRFIWHKRRLNKLMLKLKQKDRVLTMDPFFYFSLKLHTPL